MADVLARIVERKRLEVAERLPDPVPAVPTTRSLKAALARPGARFIMEVKRKSPSGHRGKHSVEQAVTAYAPIADAISVLTDGADFGGSLDDLRFVRERFDGPILAKDFVVDANQVSEARAAGADAVLVMMSVLDDRTAAQVLAAARRLAMDAIVEVHDEAELARALELGAEIVGINNRDLKTLKTDLAVTERLAAVVPDHVLLISESGIAARRDVERLAPIVDAFLVGSSLMAADDIAEAARALVFGRVKLCGLTRAEDVALAAAAGATHAGLIMVPGTPREVDAAQARLLADHAHRQGLKAVGVFRDAPVDTVAAVANDIGLDAVQMHGRESERDIQGLRELLHHGTEIWAVRGVDGKSVDQARAADRTLFDTAVKGASGGTGSTFDWDVLKGVANLSASIVAGGIGPDNAAEAAQLGAYAIDVSSRVEAAPGIKDETKVRALFAALRPKTRGDK
ncbi:bifunctional indole-3-glycerol-phosphate synthase TrpC/phosphoribosylanthranilate isomerase TrpF [Sphingomonas jaspsi]|uniref:bifunctional indole-3-glycerol-phosphate synthase TrpC/phosphoribosylanthranilate isomerase TrpF n=1 Tax=Sphingomonas jaspsi TaxID=392409 RepID=UPI0004B4C932|nr:bifunctional indole-3-glycerol-phosphate synthase TrpC/phosphoribosylanthranilate isomerase TrpF [Sphingomonas jaspsi]